MWSEIRSRPGGLKIFGIGKIDLAEEDNPIMIGNCNAPIILDCWENVTQKLNRLVPQA
jgi:hypothetical protein